MTNEQLKQAAERLKKSMKARSLYEVYDYETFGHLASTTLAKRLDEVAVLNWAIEYLAQLTEDADGDEPVTYSWAKALPNAIDQGGCCFFRCINDIELWISDDEGVVLHRCGGELELEITTRRAVRQLLAALQISTTKGTEP